MINGIHLANFKSAKDLPIKLGSLTVLTGLNGSGKSSVLQALALVKQSLDGNPQGTALILRGPLVQLGRSEDVFYVGAETDELSLTLKVGDDELHLESVAWQGADTLPLWVTGNLDVVTQADFFQKFQFIQADRLTPATQYLQASTPEQESGWLGCRGEFTVDYLQRNGDMKVPSGRLCPNDGEGVSSSLLAQVAPTDRLIDQTAGWLQQLSPGVRPRAVAIELTDATSLRFEYTGTAIGSESPQYRPANVGFGLTYSLPIIVACLAAPKGALLMLENPEAHLHPRGQFSLGLLLSRCAADGVQIIVETHSDHVLNGIRVAAKRNEITASDVAVHFFSRDVESGESRITSPELYTNGRFSDWPRGFFDEWSKALDELLDD